MRADKSNLRTAAGWKIDVVGYTKNNNRIKEDIRKNLFMSLNHAICDVNRIILNDEMLEAEREIDEKQREGVLEIYTEIHNIVRSNLDNYYQTLQTDNLSRREKEKLRENIYDAIRNEINQKIDKNLVDETIKTEINIHTDTLLKTLYGKEIDIEDTGDGGDIVVANTLVHYLLLLSEKATINLRERDPNIKVRIGVHVDLGYEEKDKQRILGSIRDYLERITSIGSDGDILLTESAVSTISALTDAFDESLHYGGTYPIKHGQFLKVWYYSKDGVGNNKRPKGKSGSLIRYLSRRNRVLATALITVACVGFLISGILFFNQLTLSIKVETFKADLQSEIFDIYERHQQRAQEIKNMFQYKLSLTANAFDPKLNDLLDESMLLNINRFITNITQNKDTDIQYAWVARSIDEKCTLVAYKPYDATFINRTDYSDFPWCKGIQKFDHYTTESYYATGPRDFVNTMVSKITVERPDGKSITIGYYGEALNWNSIIPPLMRYVNNDNVILVDSKGFLAADCKFGGCKKLSLDTNSDNIRDQPIKYVSSDFINEMFAGRIGGEYNKDLPYNTQLLNNWKIYLLSESERLDIIAHLSLFIVMIVLLSITFYYYLIPRYWVDEFKSQEQDR